MNKILKETLLYDFYGELLTDKQKKIYALYFFDDYSLSEIGDTFNTSRQAVSDLIKRTEKKLVSFEDKLLLIDKFLSLSDNVKEILNYTNNIKQNINDTNIVLDDVNHIDTIIKNIEGEY